MTYPHSEATSRTEIGSGRLRLWLGIWCVATLLATLFATQIYVDSGYAGDGLPWSDAFQIAFADWYVWALLAPLVHWLSRRFPIERGRAHWSVPVHVLAGVVLTAGKLFTELALVQWLTLDRAPFPTLKIYFNVLIYWVLVGVFHAVGHYRRLKDREQAAATLEARLTEARLDVLRGQLRPHFLFNTLNAISSLLHRDPEAADLMLERLGDLLRRSLDDSQGHETRLGAELETLRAYLDIEKARLADRLAVSVEAPDDLLDILVPPLILQPLAENAVRHGIASRSEGGRLEVEARRQDGRLILEVRDDGPGPPQGDSREGIGLQTTRRRLEELYGPDHRLDISRGAGGGAVVRLAIPVRRARPDSRPTDRGAGS